MFVGIQNYSSGYHREMGERPEDVARRPKTTNPHANEYRGREMGEKPWEVPTREQQAEYYRKAQAETPSYPTTARYETRPREMGERPEDVARAEQRRPKTAEEMTEQERRLDLFA